MASRERDTAITRTSGNIAENGWIGEIILIQDITVEARK